MTHKIFNRFFIVLSLVFSCFFVNCFGYNTGILYSSTISTNGSFTEFSSVGDYCFLLSTSSCAGDIKLYIGDNHSDLLYTFGNTSNAYCIKGYTGSYWFENTRFGTLSCNVLYLPVFDYGLLSNINVYYNNGLSIDTITCDGTQAIEIQGLSTITSTNTFTPYFNIDYRDEDNQSLIESYDKNLLILSGGNFKKTYTGNNEWILNVEGGDIIFTGYIPVFNTTGEIESVSNENVFNNFSDNALKVLLSNIPSYIQYVTIFAILLFLFGFIRRFKRKR